MGMLQLQLCFVLLILQFQFHPSLSQQQYRGNKALNCNSSEDQYRGYTCNGPQKSCQSYLTFRSRPPYDSPLSIADLMASEASLIASTNKAPSKSYTFPPETLVTVPVSCSCWGNTYFHNAPYTIQMNQSYFMIANETYQGLTACQTVAGTNDYFINGGGTLGGTFLAGSMIMVPVTCACPSYEQAKDKVSSLLVYMIVWGDTLYAIGNRFGVSLDSLFKANNLTENDVIYPFSPLLVPLQDTSCSENQRSFLCKPSPPAPSAKLVTILGLCIGVGFVCLFFICYFLYRHIMKRRHMIKKQNLFIKNGGLLLQKRLASSRSTDNLKLFTAEELERATDNYSKSRFLGQGGYGNVYKGMLLDGTIVAVKRSKTMDKTRIEQFINEVAILSQINHRNVVKLLGSCLETELPLLVYEFIPNGSLFDLIHVSEPESSCLSWSLRFKIACEVAGAVAYMHSAASIPIFHRDIKSSNILLDQKYSAKVSDFGTSRSVPVDKTHLTTGVQGTFGYLDPEYARSGQFTDKSDVYSFGVVLVELLTGEKPISGNENGNIVSRFVSLVNEERVEEVLDARIAGEVSKREVVVIGKLVKRCLRLNGKRRPSIKEVEIELENLVKSQACLDVCKDHEALFGEDDESGLDSEDEDCEMKLGFVDESLACVSLNMDSIYPRD